MNPENLKYTRDHEWARIEGAIATIGITHHAQEALGEVTFIELPTIGQELQQHGFMGSVESSKAASDVYSPMAGTVQQINEMLKTQPEMINKDCYGEGWICKVRISTQNTAGLMSGICKVRISTQNTAGLMSAAQYEEYLKGL